MEQQLSDLWNLNPTLQERTPKQIKFAWEDVARFHKPLDFLVGVRQDTIETSPHHGMSISNPFEGDVQNIWILSKSLIKEATTKTLSEE